MSGGMVVGYLLFARWWVLVSRAYVTAALLVLHGEEPDAARLPHVIPLHGQAYADAIDEQDRAERLLDPRTPIVRAERVQRRGGSQDGAGR
jgi:hypothetical protein